MENLPSPIVSTLPSLTVVVPVRNEEDNILPLIKEIHQALEGKFSFELIYVDDGSTDETPHRLIKAKEHYPRLVIVRHQHSYGQSQAITTGVQRAKSYWIVTIDGDGQNDPSDIPTLFEQILAIEVENVTTQRTMLTGWRVTRCDVWHKRLVSRLANTLREFFLKDKTPDTGCGLKIFPRSMFLDFPYFNHMHRYMSALAILSGDRVFSIPVNHRPRVFGRSHYGTIDRLWAGIFDIIGVLWLQRRSHPNVVSTDEGDNTCL